MTRICIILLGFLTGICAHGCGAFIPKAKKSSARQQTFVIARATNASTAGVTTQSTSPLNMFEGGIGNVTTMALTFNKLVWQLQTNLSPSELRERNPRVTMRFGNATRNVELQVSETGIHEAQFLNINVSLLGNVNQERPQIEDIEDIIDLPNYAKVLVVSLSLSGKPHQDDGTNFVLTLVKAETAVQQIRGVRLTEDQKKPNEWPLNHSGFNVTWVNDDLVK
jgi:hypothetical protein